MIKIEDGIPYSKSIESVYFCESCGKVVEVCSNPERLYFCACGKSGDYVNCSTMPFGEYVYQMMKRFAGSDGSFNDGIDKTNKI